ncbi:MAG: 3-deoxy-7-phosphoheptulonate synthase class II, partial [Rickettsiales bacterium]|nr:3-deoxy-7-phosphoheptulonate synthase class II [Rickettsiales bacterium]
MSTAPKLETQTWNTDSWKDFPIQQQPDYQDADSLKQVCHTLKGLPPLTSPEEARALKKELALAAQGKAFLL